MFSNHIFYLLYIFNFCGFCTELSELRASRWRHLKWTLLVLVVNLIGLCCVCGFVWRYLDQFYEGLDFLNVTNDVIKFAGAAIARLFIVFESFAKRNIQRNFWKIFHEIRSKYNRSDRDLRFGRYFMKVGQFFGVAIVIEYIQYSRWGINRVNLCFLIATFSMTTLRQFRIFHYLFFIHLLDHQLDEIEIGMKLLADSSENGQVSKERLKWMRMHYDLVFDLSNCINEVFGWSNVINVLYLVLQLALDLIFNYSQNHWKTGVNVEGSSCQLFLMESSHFH